jgi:hypothetical protein
MDKAVIQASDRLQVFGYTNREHYCCLHGNEAGMHRTSILKESAPPQPSHERHRSEKTLLDRIIDRYYPEIRSYMAEQ